ncbi:MAG: protein kinase [Nanoarchaeota archaeon]|nr:protein kinase [Nanoarchaeota archaeon]
MSDEPSKSDLEYYINKLKSGDIESNLTEYVSLFDDDYWNLVQQNESDDISNLDCCEEYFDLNEYLYELEEDNFSDGFDEFDILDDRVKMYQKFGIGCQEADIIEGSEVDLYSLDDKQLQIVSALAHFFVKLWHSRIDDVYDDYEKIMDDLEVGGEIEWDENDLDDYVYAGTKDVFDLIGYLNINKPFFDVLGTGVSGLVIYTNNSNLATPLLSRRVHEEYSFQDIRNIYDLCNSAFKYMGGDSEGFNKEYGLLEHLHAVNPNTKNVVQLNPYSGSVESYPFFVRLDLVEGDSLEKLISDEGYFNSDKILKIVAGIMNGLMELREAGIYFHRDLRPANVVVVDNDNPVIVDLGIASDDSDALAKDNRRYGSETGETANDLVSLGQIMYKMYTGDFLFAESDSMERTIYADKLRDYRDVVLNDFELLDEYLKKVDGKVKDERVRELIKTCILSQPEDYSMVSAMFERYRG